MQIVAVACGEDENGRQLILGQTSAKICIMKTTTFIMLRIQGELQLVESPRPGLLLYRILLYGNFRQSEISICEVFEMGLIDDIAPYRARRRLKWSAAGSRCCQ